MRVFITFVALLVCVSQSLHGQTTARWISPADGNWSDSANWDTGELPENSSSDTDVIIDLAGGSPYRIFGGANGAIGSLTIDSSDAVVEYFGSSMIVNESLNVLDGSISFASGSTLNAREINLFTDPLLLDSSTTFERARLGGDFSVRRGEIDLTEGATFTGRVALRDSGVLRVVSDNSISDPVVFDDAFILLSWSSVESSSVDLNSTTHLTLGANSKITGVGSVGDTGNGRFLNEGTIVASFAGKPLALTSGFQSGVFGPESGRFDNRGTLIARNGGILSVNPYSSLFNRGIFTNELGGEIVVEKDSEAQLLEHWTSKGSIEVHRDGKLTLGGSFASDDVRTVAAHQGSEVVVSGTWDNTGDAFNLNQRSDNFRFEGATFQGGIVHAKGAPLTFRESNVLRNMRFVGNMLVEGRRPELEIEASEIAGTITLSHRAEMLVNDSNIAELSRLTMRPRSDFALRSENQNLRWDESQSIEGSGDILFGQTGQNVRNFGIINANYADDSLLLSVGNRTADFFANRGLLQAESGGNLHIDNRGSFYNHATGTIRARADSSIRFSKDSNFVNDGTIELEDDSSLYLEGQYRTAFLDSIILADTAEVHLEGSLYLNSDEVFTPSKNFLTNQGRILGGQVDFSDANQRAATGARLFNVDIVSDVVVTSGNDITMSGQSFIDGDVEIDGGRIVLDEGVTVKGDFEIKNSGTTLLYLEQINGSVAIDGPETELRSFDDFI